jgi:molybdopterin-containing oxidoreductase family iron-sulfur binding subunit
MEVKKPNDRRDFLSKLGKGVIAGAVLSPLVSSASGLLLNNEEGIEIKNFKGNLADLVGGDFENIKLKMQDDLRRALLKPMKERRWGMAIDLRKCIGCNACTVACISENALPPGMVYRPVVKEEIGTYPNVTKRNLPKPCMQCDEPPCVDVCPVSATWKREDGIVVIDYKACIGCRYCMTACPYEHRMFDFGEKYSDGLPQAVEYDKRPSFEYGQVLEQDKHSSPVGNVRKCTFCAHRLDQGLLPQCLTTCIGGANYFGDLNDPDAVITKIVSQLNVFRLKEELGTEPKVFYLT